MVRGVTIKYDQFSLFSPDCFTGELQPHTSEIITDLEKFFIHWPGVGITYHATTTTNTTRGFKNFLENKQSLRLYMDFTNHKFFTIRSHRFHKKI